MATTTSTASKTVVGVFEDFRTANDALQDLVSHGINRDDVSVVANQHVSDQMRDAGYDPTTNIGTGAGVGAAIGGAGGLLLSLAGLAVPGIGPILAAGPLVAALGGAGIGAAVGSIVGALTNLGIPEEEAGHYAESVRRGDVLVTVRTNDAQAETVRDLLDRRGAVDIQDRVANWRDRGYTNFDQSAQPYSVDEHQQERQYYRPAVNDSYTSGNSSVDRTTGNTVDRIGDGTRDTYNNVREEGREVRDNVADAGRDLGRGARNLGEKTKDTVEDAGRSISRGASRVYHRIAD